MASLQRSSSASREEDASPAQAGEARSRTSNPASPAGAAAAASSSSSSPSASSSSSSSSSSSAAASASAAPTLSPHARLEDLHRAGVGSIHSDAYAGNQARRSIAAGPLAVAAAVAAAGPEVLLAGAKGGAQAASARLLSGGPQPSTLLAMQGAQSQSAAMGFKQAGAPSPADLAARQAALPARGASSSSSASSALQKPLLLPPPPFFLSAHLVHVACPLDALEGAVRGCLAAAAVDYEYSPAKWKAKGYLFKAGGSVHFVLRAFTRGGAAAPTGAADTYLLELQRLRGSHAPEQSERNFFIGLNLPKSAKEAIAGHIARFRALPEVRAVDKLYTWTPPDMFHITIHYFGALSDEQLGRVLSQLGASAKPTPLQWEVDSLGMFPTRDSLALPNILWVHPHSTSPNFQKFYEDVHAACGLPSKWRGFQAHITIARLRKIEAAHRPALTALAQILGHEKKGAQPPSGEPLELATARALSLAESASKIQPPLRFTINHVALMYNGGRCYIEHATFPFAGVAS